MNLDKFTEFDMKSKYSTLYTIFFYYLVGRELNKHQCAK